MAASSDKISEHGADLRSRFPTAYTILFLLIVPVAALTWAIPEGQYDRAMNEEIGRGVAVQIPFTEGMILRFAILIGGLAICMACVMRSASRMKAQINRSVVARQREAHKRHFLQGDNGEQGDDLLHGHAGFRRMDRRFCMTDQTLGVHSETGRLRHAIVCKPGFAHRRLTRENCEELLFDDAFWIRQAQKDHDVFADVMRRGRGRGARYRGAAVRNARHPQGTRLNGRIAGVGRLGDAMGTLESRSASRITSAKSA